MDWIVLAATIGLLVVTAWYAKTTRDMANANQAMAETAARAAEDSARATAAAERSADAARDAAAVAESQIRPDFDAEITSTQHGETYAAVVKLTATGDPVVVKEVIVRRGFRMDQDGVKNPVAALTKAPMEPYNSESALPQRIHRGEVLLMTHAALNDEHPAPFNHLLIDVRYAFLVDGEPAGERLVIATAPGPGVLWV